MPSRPHCRSADSTRAASLFFTLAAAAAAAAAAFVVRSTAVPHVARLRRPPSFAVAIAVVVAVAAAAIACKQFERREAAPSTSRFFVGCARQLETFIERTPRRLFSTHIRARARITTLVLRQKLTSIARANRRVRSKMVGCLRALIYAPRSARYTCCF